MWYRTWKSGDSVMGVRNRCSECGTVNRGGGDLCWHRSCGAGPALANPVPSTTHHLPPLQPGSVLRHPSDGRRRYGILFTRELPASIYYDALDLTCQICNHPQSEIPSDGLCLRCRMPLRPVLIHERPPRQASLLSSVQLEQLLHLSTGHVNILPHLAILQYQESFYTVTGHPGTWGVVGYGRRQRSPEEALNGTAQAGRALVYLHSHNFVHTEVSGASLESLIATERGKHIKLADLSTCTPMSSDERVLWKQIGNDLAFLACLLFYLATGQELARAGIENAPATLQPFIERALRRQYATVQEMLADLMLQPAMPTPGPLKYSCGQATHPGLKRSRNEDVVVSLTLEDGQPPAGFYLVADGMGGHEAGDLASNIVKQAVTDQLARIRTSPELLRAHLGAEGTLSELLTQTIPQANRTLFQYAQKQGSSMGATVTAALVVGDLATVANVGDSRTYLLREGRLEQLTQDHSLVARLVDVGMIAPHEARTHPQRNQIYRCLGHRPDIEVDIFTRQLQGGDILLLCSDGLWGMVEDAEICRILKEVDTPQQACDALVEAANNAGGEDNIGVIVVKLEGVGENIPALSMRWSSA
jgi:serine/threonine protein phosphatase PrpC